MYTMYSKFEFIATCLVCTVRTGVVKRANTLKNMCDKYILLYCELDLRGYATTRASIREEKTTDTSLLLPTERQISESSKIERDRSARTKSFFDS